MQKLIDLSHSIADGKVTYPGIPAPIICDFLSREASAEHHAEGVSFCINQIDMPANTGTYIDSPFHRYADGADLAELPDSGFVFNAAPVKVHKFSTFPVRAYAVIET